MNKTIYNRPVIFFLIVICMFVGCRQKPSPDSSANAHKTDLTDYKVAPAPDDYLLGNPVRIKYEGATGHLFILDLDQHKVIEMDSLGSVITEYGGEGRGPGEVLLIENFFVTEDHLYLIDPRQYVIHKYDRYGNVVSSLKYEDLLVPPDRGSGGPPPAPEPIFDDNNNHPYITLNGNIMLHAHEGSESLFRLYDWQGNHLADIGDIPKEYDPAQEREQIRAAVANREVPATDLHQAFPVSDRSNPAELFMVYSAIPKIAKYDMSGSKLWEREIPATPEVDSLVFDLIYLMNEYNYRDAPRHRKYVWGTSSPAGELYLSTYTNSYNRLSHRPLWIHQFSPAGELINRYKLRSESELSYFPGIDHSGRRIYTILKEELEIRSYTF